MNAVINHYTKLVCFVRYWQDIADGYFLTRRVHVAHDNTDILFPPTERDQYQYINSHYAVSMSGCNQLMMMLQAT